MEIYENKNIDLEDIYVRSSISLEDALIELEKSYPSILCYNNDTQEAYYKVNPINIKSLSKSVENYLIDDNNYISYVKEIKKIEIGIICPTYTGHLKYFKMLFSSIIYVEDKITFVTVFSSIKEMKIILDSVYNDCKFNDNINYEYIIYDVSYSKKNKFNYQSTKKLWSLIHLDYKYMIILDSDFELINKFNTLELINKYNNIIFINKHINKLVETDRKVINSLNKFLDTKYNFMPLEGPWIIEKEQITELNNYLSLRDQDWLNTMLNDLKNLYFEIILYRFYILKTNKDYYKIYNIDNLALKYNNYFLYDMDLDNNDICIYDFEINKLYNKDNSKTYIMNIYNDRIDFSIEGFNHALFYLARGLKKK